MKIERPIWADDVIAPQISGIPPYVPGKPISELTRELGIKNAIKMASNENPLGPSPLAMKAISASLKDIHIYPEASAPDLRLNIAAKFNVNSDCVIVGNGSDEIMALAAHVFLQKGSEAIMGEIAFSMYRICVQAFGGNAIRVPLNDYKNDLDAMYRAVTDKTRLIFIAIPNSPTGTIVSRREFEDFLSSVKYRKLVVVVDEAYAEYVQDPDCPQGIDYIADSPPVLVLRTFSKIYGLAGLRIGYGIGPEWIIELLNRVKPPFNANLLAQIAANEALHDEDHLERSREVTRTGLVYLYNELTSIGFSVIPSEANFITFCGTENARSIYEGLLRQGIIIRHLASFGMEKCIRVTVGTMDENKRFMAGLKETLRIIQSS